MNDLLKRILIPLDGSANSERVLHQSRRLLRRPAVEVLLVHVIDSMALDVILRATMLPRLRSEAVLFLSRAAESLQSAGIRVRTMVRDGLVWEQIVDAAESEECTLIALSTHGRSGLSRWMLGSVAEKLIRASPVPILAFRSFEAGPGGAPVPAAAREIAFRKLLVPIDGGEFSLSSLAPAECLARACGSTLVLVHIESTLDFPKGTFTTRLVDRPREDPGHEVPDHPSARLVYAGSLMAYRGLEVVTVRVGGDAASRIVDLPRELEADAIVMASRARKGLSGFVLGGVTERVLRHSSLPLLIVPPPEPRA